ncbi:hypothetical protein ALC57_18207 [Trachymyrmex cornetzi]|uniref:Uncharacterized protein n=1 Tax=Trachymyrmex cornetzi TaxID=471704 RepID=A0A195D9Z1_9HYME|nr:hypothetical protein ALC57_18207 [Trachymyrmex cornetzi]
MQRCIAPAGKKKNFVHHKEWEGCKGKKEKRNKKVKEREKNVVKAQSYR